jgi:Ring finger domain
MSTPSTGRPRLSDDDELVDVVAASPRKTPARLFAEEQPQFTPSSDEEAVDERIRLEREEEESMELARRLMAEEAMASYQQHFQLLRESADLLSQEDYDALQSALEEDEHEHVTALENEDGELSYDAMLELGDRIGDVKSERWAMVAEREVQKLPTFTFAPSSLAGSNTQLDDSEHKCLVCQCEYEGSDELRRLPCGHCFHTDCVDQWLKGKDACPYCRQCIVQRE